MGTVFQNNAHLDAYYAKGGGNWEDYQARRDCINEFGFAIPTPEAIGVIVQHSPVVEIGAGGGYWAHLVQQAGGVIHPYDIAPPVKLAGKNAWRFTKEWSDVRMGGPEVLLQPPYSDGTWSLFLCWPYMDDMALRCLQNFRGNMILYVGEWCGGCTATDAFFARIEADYAEEAMIRLPQWSGIHDNLWVYRKRGKE